MRLVHAGLIKFERPANCDQKKGKPQVKKRPVSAFATVQARVDTGKKGVKVNKR